MTEEEKSQNDYEYDEYTIRYRLRKWGFTEPQLSKYRRALTMRDRAKGRTTLEGMCPNKRVPGCLCPICSLLALEDEHQHHA